MALAVGVCDMCQVTLDTWHVTPGMGHLTCDARFYKFLYYYNFSLKIIGATIHTHQKIQ